MGDTASKLRRFALDMAMGYNLSAAQGPLLANAADENERLRSALDELVSHIEAEEEHSPAQRDEHYETDCPICNALTEAVAALTGKP